MAFNDYVGELVGTYPRLSAPYAATLFNRAWRRVRDFRNWSFNQIPDQQVIIPAIVTTGIATVAFGSPLVTLDAAANTALGAVALASPPLASPILGIGRQFQATSSNGLNMPNGPYYSIIAYDPAGMTLTLDKPYGETSGPTQYQVLKIYYSPPPDQGGALNTPSPNFIKFVSITNKKSGYAISGRRLTYNQEMLNAYDPQRGSTGGDSYVVASWGKNAYGQPIFELFPGPTNPAAYYCSFVARWPDISPSIDLPQVPYELPDCVMHLAMVHTDKWASRNIAQYPELAGTNWVAMMAADKQEFKEALIQCIKQDDEIFPLREVKQGSSWADFPLGGQYLQSHDLSPLFP